jgi:EpsI family protein
MVARLVIVGLTFLLGAGVIARATKIEPVPVRKSFATFPTVIDGWQGSPSAPFDRRILGVLGVDDYINLVYARPQQAPISVYIGYYRSQREGDTIHSPLNCIPGSGWQPVSKHALTIPVTDGGVASGSPAASREIVVNRYVIEKGADRQLVLYWYQSQGRVVASEYASKVFMVWDAMRTARTDAALVRIITPFNNAEPTPEVSAERRATDFVKSMFPLLAEYLPS